MKEPSQADLIRKRLMTVRMRLYATQLYLDQRGTPTRMEDLSHHRLICQNVRSTQVGAAASMVNALMGYELDSLLTVNNYFGVLQATLNNLGIGVLPEYVANDFPQLVPLLEEADSGDIPVFLAYPEELRHSKRIGAFRDFVQDEIITYRKQVKNQQFD